MGRQSEAGAWYVITTVTRDREPLFLDARAAEEARRELLSLPPSQVSTHAWVLMPDHLHWLLELGTEIPLSALVQAFKSRSARTINQRLEMQGSRWQAGYYDHRVRRDEDLRRQAQYVIVLGPATAGGHGGPLVNFAGPTG